MTQKGREGAERNEEWREEGAEKGATQRSIKSDKREIDYGVGGNGPATLPFRLIPRVFSLIIIHKHLSSVPKAV